MSTVLTKAQVRAAVAAAITAERERAGISQRELARRVQVDAQYVNQWEKGKGCSDYFVYRCDDALGLERGTLHRLAAGYMAWCSSPYAVQARWNRGYTSSPVPSPAA